MQIFRQAVLLGLILSIGGFRVACAQPPVASGYQAAWWDDFSGSSLNTSLWTAVNTNSPTNNSLQDYLPEQVTVENGNLVITSENVSSRGLPYRSGQVISTTTQQYGRWEVRAKLPTSQGMWPAIWLLSDQPWPSGGEIDIMENRGDQPNLTSSAVHWGTNPPFSHDFTFREQKAIHNGQLVNYHNSFHTYAAEWDPGQVRFYVDDVHFATIRDSDTNGYLASSFQPMRLIINTAVGGTFSGNPDGSTQWPQRFEVDYVYAYDRLSGGPTLTFENGGFEANGGSLAHWSTFGNEIPNVTSGHEAVGSGTESLKLFGQFNGVENFSGVEQGLSVIAGQELFASADAFISSLDSISGTSNEVFLKIDYYSEVYGAFGSPEYLGSDGILLADGSTAEDVWANSAFTSTVPAGAVEARLAIVFAQRNNDGGSVFVDNVQFFSVPEPSIAWILMGVLGCLILNRRSRLLSVRGR